MDKSITSEDKILSVRLEARTGLLPYVLDMIEQFTIDTGFERNDALKMRLSVEEASVNVIEHAFDPDERGEFEVSIVKRPNQFVVAIEDRGLPTDFSIPQNKEASGIGTRILRAMTDEVRFLNLGVEGKRVELIKNIKYKDITSLLSAAEIEEIEHMDKTRIEHPTVNFRLMEPSEAISLSRCVYRSYAYSYTGDYIYYPERIRDMIESGLLKSCIAVNENDEIIGHLGLTFDRPGALVGETGQAMVDPRYRGHKLFERMKEFAINHARETGLAGVYSESVTIHPFTQKGNISLGAVEIGVLLGYIPETLFFKKIEGGEQVQRQTAILFFLKVNDTGSQRLYLPERHSELLREIYRRNNLDREFVNPEGERILDKVTQADVEVRHNWGQAFIKIREYGENFQDMIQFRLRELKEKKISCIYVDLPLWLPETAKYYEYLESLGFILSGAIPELGEGDVVRFQYLNNVFLDPDKIIVYSDFGKKVFSYIINEYNKIYK
ncbi:MAG: GNAT family N-acetyltransferase [Candidatus Kapaibacterium sp.]